MFPKGNINFSTYAAGVPPAQNSQDALLYPPALGSRLQGSAARKCCYHFFVILLRLSGKIISSFEKPYISLDLKYHVCLCVYLCLKRLEVYQCEKQMPCKFLRVKAGVPLRSLEQRAQGNLASNISARGPKAPEACLDAFSFPLPEFHLSEFHFFFR